MASDLFCAYISSARKMLGFAQVYFSMAYKRCHADSSRARGMTMDTIHFSVTAHFSVKKYFKKYFKCHVTSLLNFGLFQFGVVFLWGGGIVVNGV